MKHTNLKTCDHVYEVINRRGKKKYHDVTSISVIQVYIIFGTSNSTTDVLHHGGKSSSGRTTPSDPLTFRFFIPRDSRSRYILKGRPRVLGILFSTPYNYRTGSLNCSISVPLQALSGQLSRYPRSNDFRRFITRLILDLLNLASVLLIPYLSKRSPIAFEGKRTRNLKCKEKKRIYIYIFLFSAIKQLASSEMYVRWLYLYA